MDISTQVANNKEERGRERSKRKKRKCQSESKERVNSKKSKTQSKERKFQESRNKRNNRNNRNKRGKDRDKNNNSKAEPKKKSFCIRTNSPSDSDIGSSDSMGELIIEDENMDEIVKPMNDIYTDQISTSTVTPNNKAHNKSPQQLDPKTEFKLPGRVFAGQLKPTFSKSKPKPRAIANKPKSPRKSTLIPIKLKPAIIKSTLGNSLSSNNPLIITPLSPTKKDKENIPLGKMYLLFPQPVSRPKLALQPSFTG